ncbi:MAG: YggT family protein [Lysobacterales bacterium]
MNYLSDAGALLINTLFGLLLGVLLLRIALQAIRANFYNPICQAIYKVTNPILMPLQRFVPVRRGLHWPGLVLAWLLALVWMWVLHALRGMAPGPVALLLLGLAKLLDFALVMAMLLIVLRALLSLVGGGYDGPMLPVIAQLTDPLLRPIQRILPALGGFDFSPLFAILAITLLRILVVRPLFDFAAGVQ